MRRALLLATAVLLAGCTGSQGPDLDFDRDAVDDAIETQGKIIDITLPTGMARRNVTSDPRTADTDGDGLLDGDELLVRLSDPRDVDTDDDGLLDGHDRSPPDGATRDTWRAAGILDVNGTFLGELDACPPGGPQLRPNVASSDLPVPDLLLDGEELRGWDVAVRGSVRRVVSDPCAPDTDGDGFLDHEEKALRLDPRARDTDQDGAPDGGDADPLWDLGLRFEALRVEGTNATSVRVVFALGGLSADLTWPGNDTATLDVSDASPDRESLDATLIATAEEATTGRALALFDDPRGAILVFDLLEGTVGGVEGTNGTLRFSGEDGTVSFRWSTLRR